eukprot:6770831-Lingulodinium_polyedra.AAC.1
MQVFFALLPDLGRWPLTQRMQNQIWVCACVAFVRSQCSSSRPPASSNDSSILRNQPCRLA